jgi:iron complex outermembrane receptor protein
VPIAVGVVSAEALQAEGLASTEALSAAVLGLDMTRASDRSTPFLRGVGAPAVSLGVEPSVATYIDGVYVSSPSAALFAFNDIERVEVLKGPQGTLFGRNATGGVIQVVTPDPSDTFSSKGSIGYGNYDTFEGTGYVTGGIAPGVAADLAIYYHNQEQGYGENLTTGMKAHFNDERALRDKIKWTIDDATTLRLSFDFFNTYGDAGMAYMVLPGTIDLNGKMGYVGFYNTLGSVADRMSVRQGGAALDFEHDFGWATLVDIASYRREHTSFLIDANAVPEPILFYDIFTYEREATNELRLQSKDEGILRWIGGLYYFDSNAAYGPLNIFADSFSAPVEAIRSEQETKSYAIFAQATVKLSATTNLTAGARDTDDRRTVTGAAFIPGVPGSVGPGGGHSTADQPTYRLALDQTLMDDVMVYASYNRGFKSGSFNTLAWTLPPVRPETLNAYEIGLKSEFLDHKARLNGSAFYYDYKNIQVQSVLDGVAETTNAAKARIEGFDLDFQLKPIQYLTLSGGIAYTDGVYTSFPNAPVQQPVPGGGNVLVPTDISGSPTIHTPKWQTTLAVQYVQPTAAGEFGETALYSYNHGYNFEVTPITKQPAYHLVNLSAYWAPNASHLKLTLWVRNLLDEHYFTYNSAQQAGDFGSPADPRTYGMTASFAF